MGTRRQLLQGLGIGLIAGSAVTPGLGGAARSRQAKWTSDSPPWWLIAPLTSGRSLGRGWRVDSLTKVHEGAAVLSLQHRDERTARVHICTHDGQPRGLAHSVLFDLVLMDGRQGKQSTEESLGRVLVQLARHIRRNELQSDDSHIASVKGLLTHDDRVILYGPEALV